jgi:RND family efflux transporter MFP subunit
MSARLKVALAGGEERALTVPRDAVVLMALDTIRVEAPLPQRYYSQVQPGARVELRFDALPDQRFEGEVVAKVAAGDARSRNFPLLIDLPNPDHRLAPGMSARLKVALAGGEERALTVPRDAVVLHSDGRREVWRLAVDGEGTETVQPVQIETGRAMGERLAVVSGDLNPGDRIVLLGNESLKPGQTVTSQPAE